MAKTRSKGPVSPKTPVSAKGKKILKEPKPESAVSSPSVKKTKNIKPKKAVPAEPEKKEEVSGKVVADAQIQKALSEIAKFLEREAASKETKKSDLFEQEEEEDPGRDILVGVTSKKFFSDKPNFKPVIIRLTKPALDVENLKTCLIMRDRMISTEAELAAVENANLPTLTKILTLRELKTDYKQYEKRRQLFSEYDLFVADDATLNSLPTTLGKAFYARGNRKLPIPLSVTEHRGKEFNLAALKENLTNVLTSTWFLPPVKDMTSIRVGAINKNFTIEQLVQNVQDVVSSFDINTITSISVKARSSPSLPIFYAEKLYVDENTDILENVKEQEAVNEDSAFEKGLLELADADTVTKILGHELKKSKKAKKTEATNGVSK